MEKENLELGNQAWLFNVASEAARDGKAAIIVIAQNETELSLIVRKDLCDLAQTRRLLLDALHCLDIAARGEVPERVH